MGGAENIVMQKFSEPSPMLVVGRTNHSSKSGTSELPGVERGPTREIGGLVNQGLPNYSLASEDYDGRWAHPNCHDRSICFGHGCQGGKKISTFVQLVQVAQ